MTVLTVELPDFTSPSGNAARIRFQDTTTGLIDATALRIITGDAIITRLQINGDQDRCLMQIVETLGDPPGDVNPSLSGVWEQYNPAIILQATGLADLEISGPVATGSDSTDTTEPYSWLPGSLITYTGGLEQWVSDFKAAYAADTTLRATMVLDDGVVAGSIVVELDGADAGSTSAEPIAATVLAVTNVAVELDGADAGATTAAPIAATVLAAPAVINVAVELDGADAGSTSAAQIAATVAGNVSLEDAFTVTHKTNRLDLLAREALGSDSDATRRQIIRWNAARFAARPSFWLEPGEHILTAPPEPAS